MNNIPSLQLILVGFIEFATYVEMPDQVGFYNYGLALSIIYDWTPQNMTRGIYKRSKKTLEMLKEKSVFQKGHKGFVKPGYKIKDSSRMGKWNKNKKWNNPKQSIKMKGNKYAYKGGSKHEKMLRTATRIKPECCEICGAIGRICFDHDHKTKKFRGWLCIRCNSALGMVKDNYEILISLAEYLKNNL